MSIIIFLIYVLFSLCACVEKTDKKIVSDAPIIQSGTQNEDNQDIISEKEEKSLPEYANIDIDLSSMKGTITYSQVYDMIYNSSKYEGKIVKMQGPFSVFYSNTTKLFYSAVIIKDATACCSQGIEFVLYDNPDYPSGYPKTNTEITVVGEFKIYYEGSNVFCHLVNAVIL